MQIWIGIGVVQRVSIFRPTRAFGDFGDSCERRSESGDPADDEYPDKPPRMRWATYNRVMDKLVTADDVANEQLVLLAARWLEP
jgi:hypothetical protein